MSTGNPDLERLAALPLASWTPRSSLRAAATAVTRSSVPSIDIHNHLGRWLSEDGDWMIADVAGLVRRASLSARRAASTGRSIATWDGDRDAMTPDDLTVLADLRVGDRSRRALDRLPAAVRCPNRRHQLGRGAAQVGQP